MTNKIIYLILSRKSPCLTKILLNYFYLFLITFDNFTLFLPTVINTITAKEENAEYEVGVNQRSR